MEGRTHDVGNRHKTGMYQQHIGAICFIDRDPYQRALVLLLQPPPDIEPLRLVSRKLRRPLRAREREPRLDKDLLHPVLVPLELVVHLVEVVERDAVRNHLQRVQRAAAHLFEEAAPILVHGGLAVADEADAALHEGADVEVVCLPPVSWCLLSWYGIGERGWAELTYPT